ncbi:FMN-binding negative transcriptional regulator [Marinobacterium arenosum]|uniref:FMN-binding negative transcriptional regulator n=1 Tax=Marinobacterium arenosum TaxID=2862496 RepID=UPI001C96F36C|nr:FMN-binding negative transcriptional regulator [Marinobacterium arenosum]MBY4677829.1 FMN-binding negative transcriptional regulator [Marinobacterium arenosum]
MYVPGNMQMASTEQAQAFVDQFGFGVLVSEPLQGSHLPFLLNRSEGHSGTLYSHFAKANPHWQDLDGKEVLIIFSGPHSYISPTWYAAAPAVPTWNYAAVHAYGVVRLLDGPRTLEVVEQTVAKYEPELLAKRDILTDAFRDRLLAGIVGFKVELSRLEGKLKLGQHRKPADQQGVWQGLQASDDLQAQALAQYMARVQLGTGQ